jgi:hypothetical protein
MVHDRECKGQNTHALARIAPISPHEAQYTSYKILDAFEYMCTLHIR